jgi:ankyrin repeat protein
MYFLNTYTTMERAIRKNDIAKVQSLLDGGEDVNKVYSEGITALTSAAILGHVEIAKLLIDKGANLDVQDQDGDTPLISAAVQGHDDIAKLLIEKGANLDIQGMEGNTALIHASLQGHEEIAKLLIEKGVNLNLQNEEGETALIVASKEGETDIAKLLIEKGADLDAEDESGTSAAIFAAVYGHLEILKMLIDKGVDVDAEDGIGRTSLFYAAQNNQIDVVKLLIEKGAHLNITDDNGNTALIRASEKGRTEIVRLLVESGASLTAENEYGKTAFDVAPTDEIRNLLRPPVAQSSAKEPKEVEYTTEPMCFDMLENEDISVLQALTTGKTIFKIGNVYNSTETRVLLEQLEKNENLRYKCKQESVELRTLRPEDVNMDKTYYLLTLVGNYMVDMKELASSLQSGYRVFELAEMGEELEFTASRDVLYDDKTGRSLNGQELNYVGADHCQKGTNRKPYTLEPVSFIKKKVGGRKTYRKKLSKRRKTYRK